MTADLTPTMPLTKWLSAILATLAAAMLLFLAGMAHAAENMRCKLKKR